CRVAPAVRGGPECKGQARQRRQEEFAKIVSSVPPSKQAELTPFASPPQSTRPVAHSLAARELNAGGPPPTLCGHQTSGGLRHMLDLHIKTILLLFASAALATASSAQTKPGLSQSPVSPQVQFDPDGVIHWGPRTIPFPPLASAASRDAYVWLLRYA